MRAGKEGQTLNLSQQELRNLSVFEEPVAHQAEVREGQSDSRSVCARFSTAKA